MTSMINPNDLSLQTGIDVTELIIIDAGVSDKSAFYAQQRPGVAVVEIDAAGDGLAQLGDILVGYSGLNSVHLVAHGDAGQLQLGNSVIDAADLQAEAQALAALNAALRDGGDILLYGCEVGHGGTGLELLNTLADGAKADVAAYDDLTGAASLGGDWDLEIQTGDIEAQSFSAASMARFDDILAIPGTIGFDGTGTDPNVRSPDGSIDASYTNGGYTLVANGASVSAVISDGYLYSGGSGFGIGESSITFSLSSGQAFDLTAISLSNVNSYNQTFEITTNKGGTAFNTGGLGYFNGFYTQNPTGTNFQGINSFTIQEESSFGNDDFALVIDNIAISNITAPPNAAPTATGIPTDITVPEDPAFGANFDLSAVTFADAENDSLTVTLTGSSGSFTASSSGGVTIGGSGSGTLTLAGTVANLNTYLDTASNIRYTGVTNLNGDNAATFSIAANDGTSNPTLGGGNIDITPVNDFPDITPAAPDIAVVEDTPTNFDLSNLTISDADNDTLTLILSTNSGSQSGSFAASTGGGVTVSGSGTRSIELTGSGAAITSYLDTASNIVYTPALNRESFLSYTLVVRDPSGSEDIESASINISAVNDPPAINSANAVSVTENSTVAYQISTTLPDGGESYTFNIVGGADASLFNVSGPGTIGELSFITPPDFENPTDDGGDNVYNVDITASDAGGTTAPFSVAITVTDVNEAPPAPTFDFTDRFAGQIIADFGNGNRVDILQIVGANQLNGNLSANLQVCGFVRRLGE